MSDLIGEARVRLRPDTRGFQSETQSAIKAPLVSIGKFITGALAIKGGFDLGKELLSDAARVQKSSEVIRAEFGKSGDAIIEFADTAGLKLGLAAHVTEDTAARFGILFKNIGVGKGEAAAMTLNLEKLAGSIAAIRGKDPAQILGTLPLALSGSLRGLRQLGFAFTPVQLKEEALRLGLIKTQKQALDPGARAIAIYGLVTKNLGDYQDQAAKHASDAYNIQKRLSAEWDHAKEVVGTGLLPEVAKYGGELSDWIDKGTKSGQIQKELNTISADGKIVITDVAKAVKFAATGVEELSRAAGGGKALVQDLILTLASVKVLKFAASVGKLRSEMLLLKKVGPIAISITVAEIITHGGFKGFGEAVAKHVHKELVKIKAPKFLQHFFDPRYDNSGNLIKEPSSGLPDHLLPFPLKDPLLKKLTQAKAADLGAGISKGIIAGIQKKEIAKATAETALTALKAAATVANNDAAQQLKDARYQVSQARDTLAQAVIDSKRAVADSINQAKQNLNSIAASIAGDASKAGTGPLTGILGARLKELQARIKSGQGGIETQRLAQELQNQIAIKANAPGAGGGLARRLADLADRFNRGSIGKGAADKGLDQILKSAGINASVIQRGQGVAAADQFRAEVAAFKAQVAATATGPQGKGSGFAVAIVKPLEVLHQQNRIIAQDAHAVGQAQLGVQRAALHVQQTAATEAKKRTKLLEKIAANQPSKHDTAELNALLRKQSPSKTAKDAAAATSGRHGG